MATRLLISHDGVDVVDPSRLRVLLADNDREVLARTIVWILPTRRHVQIFAIRLGHVDDVEAGDPAALLDLLSTCIVLHALAEVGLPRERSLRLVVMETAVVAALGFMRVR